MFTENEKKIPIYNVCWSDCTVMTIRILSEPLITVGYHISNCWSIPLLFPAMGHAVLERLPQRRTMVSAVWALLIMPKWEVGSQSITGVYNVWASPIIVKWGVGSQWSTGVLLCVSITFPKFEERAKSEISIYETFMVIMIKSCF